MNIKYKIIIIIFVGIILLYAGQFILTSLHHKYENFSSAAYASEAEDDIEHYEEPKKISQNKDIIHSEDKYDQRILILDDIEKLQIKDKNIKGKLMELLFNEDSIKELNNKNGKERLEFIESKYKSLDFPSQKLNSDDVSKKHENVHSETLHKKNKDFFEEEKEFDNTKDLLNKTNESLNHLQYVQNSIKDIQDYVKSAIIKSNRETLNFEHKDPYIPSPPSIPANDKHQNDETIEGFENVPNYASFS